MSDMGSPQRGKYSTGESVSHGALPSSRPPDHQQQQAYREQQHPQHASGPQQQHSSEQQQQYPGARPQQERVPWDGAASGPLPQRGHVSGPIPMAASHRSSSSTSTGTGGWSGNLGMGHGAYPPSPTPSSLSAPTSRPAAAPAATDPSAQETQELFREGYAFEGAAIVALVDEEGGLDATGNSTVEKKMEIVLEDGVLLTLDLDSGEKRLRELGYTQTLQRDLTGFELFSAGFNCVSLFAGIVPYYSTAYANGGPVAVVWYWWIPGVLANLMALSLAEIASSFPLAGSMYFWAAHLAPPRIRPLAAWITGWLEFIGASVGAGGTVLAGIILLCDIMQLSRPSEDPLVFTRAQQFGMAAGVLCLLGILNLARVKTLGQLLAASAVYQILLGLFIMVGVPIIAPTTQPASFVFGSYESNWVGAAPNAAYAFIIAMLLSQYSLYAMDTAAHISEEAKRADLNTPVAMVASLGSITVLAWGILVALTFSIQSEASLTSPDSVTGGSQYAVQILWDVFYGRYGSGVGALVMVGLIYVSFFFCSTAQIMTAARVAYALARDGGLPFSSLFSRIDSRKVPIPAVILTCSIALVSLIPSLVTLTAYYAVTGMATVGWFSAYAVPICLRLVLPESKFNPGPFYMTKYIGVIGGKLVHLVGLLYVLYTISVFMIPTAFPVNWDNLNYTPIGIAAVVAFFLGWWVLDARRWFRGPFIKDASVDDGTGPPTQEVGPEAKHSASGEDEVEWFHH